MINATTSVWRRRPRRRFFFLALALAACASTAPQSSRVDQVFDPAVVRQIDARIEKAIADKQTPGAVLWMEHDGVAYHRAYGNRTYESPAETMTEDTIFDAASLTKVTATTPSIWLLVQQGKVALDAPVKTYIPEFTGGWRDDITIRHLLTHTAGLRPDLTLTDSWIGFNEAWKRILAEEPTQRPGAVFRYSDINFELLGEVVHRVSGETLDQFALNHVFKPLGMNDSRFLPIGGAPPPSAARIAPTAYDENHVMLRGVVHDPTARRMGGVAGHAGLFTTAPDLAKYARALLNGGGGVLTPDTVKQMTAVQSPAGVASRRAGGFDIDTGFAGLRGELFPLGSYGHTGYTGTAIWIDPYSKTFYVLMTNRVYPDDTQGIGALRREVGTLVAKAVRGFDWTSVPGALATRAGGGVRWPGGGGHARNGIDVLEADHYAQLRGLRIGLITNHTGIDTTGNPTIDLLRSAPGVTLVALFSPEHGIRGAADEKVGDTRDEVTGLPIYSLYGERRKPSPEQLANIDALVYDIQDIGTRFYTYESTLGLAMESVAGTGKKFFVLDRVNTVGGSVAEGPVLEGPTDFVGYHNVPIRHGMTVGELARMYCDEKNLAVDLTVIGVKGWKREQWQDEAGLPWINTSPNMRSVDEAGFYPGIGLLESAISVGRGTPTPFEVVGAPYIDGDRLARELTAMNLPGIAFTPVRFTPDASIHKGEPCGGVRMQINDRRALRSVDVGIAIATQLVKDYGAQFPADKMARLLRHPATLDAIKAGKSLDEIHRLWVSDFDLRRGKYLLY
ncbi:MAG TPA: exo-beta-N-acetylmuramidase NamZ domain-containing protein [Thermoanaerobaculia bacterium]|nr:exo-beta-N-acetylmuramidase NamZ domain-containing protein [Thermoanaerobaculia bacterium]